jgi:hypothetical protein
VNKDIPVGIVHGLPDAAYHSRPELSSTEARLLLQSPAKYRWRKDNPPIIDDSPKFDIGKAVHAKVLGQGAEVVVIAADDWRSKAARDARQEARDAGKAPLLTREFEAVNAMAESVLAHPTGKALLSQPGDTEVSLFTSIDGVPVRARFDFLPDAVPDRRVVAVDLKTTADASKRAFEKSVATYEYTVQRAWYLEAYAYTTGAINDTEMVFLAVEKEPPYLVAVYQVPSVWAEKGHVMAARARSVWKQCNATGEWSGYAPTIQLLDEPTWHVYQYEEEYANA